MQKNKDVRMDECKPSVPQSNDNKEKLSAITQAITKLLLTQPRKSYVCSIV